MHVSYSMPVVHMRMGVREGVWETKTTLHDIIRFPYSGAYGGAPSSRGVDSAFPMKSVRLEKSA